MRYCLGGGCPSRILGLHPVLCARVSMSTDTSLALERCQAAISRLQEAQADLTQWAAALTRRSLASCDALHAFASLALDAVEGVGRRGVVEARSCAGGLAKGMEAEAERVKVSGEQLKALATVCDSGEAEGTEAALPLLASLAAEPVDDPDLVRE